MPYFKYC